MNRWIDNETVKEALKSGNDSLLTATNVPFAISGDFRFCILLRDHAAWYIEDEGWRDGNYPPEPDGDSRPMLNFYGLPTDGTPGFWYKAHIPSDVTITSLENSAPDKWCVHTDSSKLYLSYSRLPRLQWTLMTGKALSEDDILTKFQAIWDDE